MCTCWWFPEPLHHRQAWLEEWAVPRHNQGEMFSWHASPAGELRWPHLSLNRRNTTYACLYHDVSISNQDTSAPVHLRTHGTIISWQLLQRWIDDSGTGVVCLSLLELNLTLALCTCWRNHMLSCSLLYPFAAQFCEYGKRSKLAAVDLSAAVSFSFGVILMFLLGSLLGSCIIGADLVWWFLQLIRDMAICPWHAFSGIQGCDWCARWVPLMDG